MPENDGFGPNEAVWRTFSAKYLAIALSWPDEQLFRFTQHRKFENLTPADQAVIRQKLQAKLAPSAAATPPPSSVPTPPSVTEKAKPLLPLMTPSPPKPTRTPVTIEPATKPAAPRRSWTEGEFAHALGRAALYWGVIMAGGTIVLKIFSGG